MEINVENYIDSILMNGLEKDYWFMTKQTMTDFYFILTIAHIVDSFKTLKKPNENFGMYYQRYFKEDETLRKRYYKQAESENTYRNSIIAEFFGLFKREKVGYDSGAVTPAFHVLEKYIKTYDDVEKYRYILERQIEKLCLNINDKIQNYNELSHVKIFPVIFIYKILLELKNKTSKSTLYYDEFVLFLFRAQKYSDWEKTINLILEYRNNNLSSEYEQKVKKIINDATALNIRFDALLGTLSNIRYEKKQNRNFFEIKESSQSYRYIENAIEIFEHSKYSQELSLQELQSFLQSDKYFLGYLDVAFVQENKEEQNQVNDIDVKPITNVWFSSPITDGQNLIVYGTPGCGKSYYVEHTLLDGYSKENYIRTTFYQDYTNTDFVGQILPVVEGDKVTYKFNPGPFTLALEQAIRKPNDRIALVIEELNRGSAASIFGDIFQLLDRKEGVSEYGITNVNIINYLKEKFEGVYTFKDIRLPGNFSIYATMNTSDQNVFTLDTAFKRRWKFKKLINEFAVDHQFKNKYIPGADITWEELVNDINEYILECSSGLNSEDKQLGVYFVDENGMREKTVDASDPEAVNAFAYKVLEYLWSDVAKFDRSKWFADGIKSLDELVKEYKEKGLEVFVDGIFNK